MLTLALYVCTGTHTRTCVYEETSCRVHTHHAARLVKLAVSSAGAAKAEGVAPRMAVVHHNSVLVGVHADDLPARVHTHTN
jgi:hypothetical protein